ncbi:hypothetical protein HPB49_019531 [Dermacentor silvarum]|uniref:Uncharacterized protein n=1 Tax=Dermacentor silvarum TaxID=543639 RepID=A0ACB8CZA2_DERSI|nr:hypothetical protein HPB49_019531 [Dermacentor silvarum]
MQAEPVDTKFLDQGPFFIPPRTSEVTNLVSATLSLPEQDAKNPPDRSRGGHEEDTEGMDCRDTEPQASKPMTTGPSSSYSGGGPTRTLNAGEEDWQTVLTLRQPRKRKKQPTETKNSRDSDTDLAAALRERDTNQDPAQDLDRDPDIAARAAMKLSLSQSPQISPKHPLQSPGLPYRQASNKPTHSWTNLEENLGSDHSIISISVNSPKIRRPRGQATITDWKAYRQNQPNTQLNNAATWAEQIRTAYRRTTKKVALTDDVPAVDSHLLHLWEAKRSLIKRWKRQRHNRKLKLRIAKLSQEANEYAQHLDDDNWIQLCASMQGTLHTNKNVGHTPQYDGPIRH